MNVTKLILWLSSWALFSTLADTTTKTIQTEFPYPVTLTLFQFLMSAISGFLILRVWGIHPYQSGWSLIGLRRITPLTLTQGVGFLLTNVSFGRVSISLTQTVKASDPLFSLVLSKLYKGDQFSTLTYLSLVPIISGVMLTAASDLSFDILGFLAGAGSNFCFSSRSILSKQFMSVMDNVNLYYYLSLTAFLFTLPLWVVTDVIPLLTQIDSAVAQVSPLEASFITFSPISSLFIRFIFCGCCHYIYNQVSYLVLSEVTPLTHAICNVARRIIVIVVTTFYFGTYPSVSNVLGIITVFGGVGLYLKAQQAPKKAPQHSV